jgi:hypothetical protein
MMSNMFSCYLMLLLLVCSFISTQAFFLPPVQLRSCSTKLQLKEFSDDEEEKSSVDRLLAVPVSSSATPPTTGSDHMYAVEAAKQIAAKQKGGGDYAVEAAKRLVQLQTLNGKTWTDKPDTIQKSTTTSVSSWVSPDAKLNEKLMERRPINLTGPSWSISTPAQRRRLQNKPKAHFQEPMMIDSSSVEPESEARQDANGDYNDVVVDVEILAQKNGLQTPKLKKQDQTNKSFRRAARDRNLNLKVAKDTQMSDFPLTFPDIEIHEDDLPELKTAKEAQRIMNDIAQQSQDMTAEELLKDILKFEEEQKQEEQVGTGFVSGAFEKAKELLREQKQKRVERKSKEVSKGPGSVDTIRVGIVDSHEETLQGERVLSAEEEIKRLFREGEKLAERQIESRESLERKLTTEQETVVDELVSKEKTVSRHARTLDEELAELEIRINRNPGEEMDGPSRNPMFDILSGPEVYNPNVDPETAVNWPGALPGSKNLRLPKELDEAVKQAKFAAGVIMKMTEQRSSKGENEESIRYYLGERELSHAEVLNLKSVVNEAVKLGLIHDPMNYMSERSRLDIIVGEMWNQPEERFKEIAENYKDLLLSDNFVGLLKERLTEMADRDVDAIRKGDDEYKLNLEVRHERERHILGHLVTFAQLLLKEARALGAQLEAQQIEVIRSICKVAMDPMYTSEEEIARALTNAVRDMRPMFDDIFVAYIKYAVAEEEGRLARGGVLDDPEHNQWLNILKIIQQGVYSEIAKGINRYIEHIWYVLRMETREQRRALLSELIDVLPTMDVRPFVQVVDNVASSLGDAAKGDIDPNALGEMTNKILQLHRDVHELLPPERIAAMAKDADEWAAKQRHRLIEQRRMTQKRLDEARETQHLTEVAFTRAAEAERYD